MCLYVSVWMCACVRRCPKKPEERIGSPGSGVLGNCEAPDMGARN